MANLERTDSQIITHNKVNKIFDTKQKIEGSSQIEIELAKKLTHRANPEKTDFIRVLVKN